MAPNSATSLLNVFTSCFRHRTSSATDLHSDDVMSTVQPIPSASRQDESDHRHLSPSASPPAKREKIVCLICNNTIRKDRYCRPCRKCKEPWCHECIRNLFTSAIKDCERMPARCCQNVIHHGVAKGILDEKTLATYKLRYEEFCTPKPFYCPIPTCSTFIPPRKLKSVDYLKRLACPGCATRLCTKCRQTAQSGHQCSTAQDAVLMKIRALKYKSCPKCGTGVLKMYGCDHIRCHCGAHWCWSCERSIDICFSDPCQAQLDDGIGPEPDTEDEEDLLEAENRGTTVGPFDGIPYEYPTASELALVSVDVPGEVAVVPPPVRPGTPAPERLADLDSVSLVASPVPDTNPTSSANVSVEPATLVEENLDDPDDHDWEYQNLDFGGEPTDERWDVWGCAHKCRRFKQDDIHEKWLNIEHLDCQNCFERVHLHNHADQQSDTNVAKRLAWVCKKCGVTFCDQCRREARAKRK